MSDHPTKYLSKLGKRSWKSRVSRYGEDEMRQKMKGYSDKAKKVNTKYYLTIDGDHRPLIDWIRHFGLNYDTVMKRLKSGKTPRQALGLDKENT